MKRNKQQNQCFYDFNQSHWERKVRIIYRVSKKCTVLSDHFGSINIYQELYMEKKKQFPVFFVVIKHGFWIHIIIDYHGLASFVIYCYRFLQIDKNWLIFYLWVRLWSITDINRCQSAIDIDWYQVYRLISDIDFYRLTPPGFLKGRKIK